MSLTDHRSHRMDREALAWATRLDGGPLGAREQGELDAWLARSPTHAWRLAHFRQFYREMQAAVPLAVGPAGRRSGPVRRSWHRIGAALLATAAVVTLTALWVAGQPRRMATDVSQRTTLALEEGTRVDLNARTSLAVALRAGERRVALARGEAFFAVAPDVRRPFVVETPAGLVRVTGTRFNVRLVGDDGLQVTVLDGAVEVRPTAASPAAQLQPGDQFVRTARTMATRHLGDAAADVAVWREGKVVFRETPLAEALAAFAGYHRQTVAVDPEVAGLTLGGRYTLDDFESFLRSLERTLPVKVLRGEREVRIVAR